MTIIESVLGVFDAIGDWIITAVNSLLAMFYTAENGLTFMGVLAVCGLAFSVIFLECGTFLLGLHWVTFDEKPL